MLRITPIVVTQKFGKDQKNATSPVFIFLIKGCKRDILVEVKAASLNPIDYKIALSGKPFIAFPAFVPVTFELTILFTAFFTVFGMFGINQLPTFNRPIFNNESIKRATCSGFFLSISADDKNFDEVKTKTFLQKSGGKNIEKIEEY